jgi:multiple antibiotic resistance protein
MTDAWTDLTRFGIGLFALLNPFTKLPLVLGVAAGAGTRGVLTIALSATVTMISVLLAMHFMGEAALHTLGTTLPSFQIGGGLVILLTGLSTVSPPNPQAASGAATPRGGSLDAIKFGVTPLGIPMLAGAGAITKVILETQPHYGIDDALLLAAVIVLVSLVSGSIIAMSALLLRLLGVSFFAVMSRLAGLVTVAVGIEIMSRGVMAHVRLFAAG